MSKPNEKWEKEFERLVGTGFFDNRYSKKANYTRVKIFIQNLLKSQREEIVGKLEGLHDDYLEGFKIADKSDNMTLKIGHHNSMLAIKKAISLITKE